MKFIVALLIPVLLYLSYVAGSWGLADVYYRPAMNKIDLWMKGKVTLTADDWSDLKQKLEHALKLDPNNPDINQWLGKAVEGSYTYSPRGDPVARSARLEAAEYYRKSIAMRPTWPYAWSDLLVVKYRLNEVDDEFFHAMHSSMKFGPWEPGILYVVSVIGFQLWNEIDQEQRLFILETAKRGLLQSNKGYVGKTLKLVEQHHFLEVLCAMVGEENEIVTDYCANKIKKS